MRKLTLSTQIYAGNVLLCVLFHTERDLPERGIDQAFAEYRQKRARKGLQVYAMYYIAQFIIPKILDDLVLAYTCS